MWDSIGTKTNCLLPMTVSNSGSSGAKYWKYRFPTCFVAREMRTLVRVEESAFLVEGHSAADTLPRRPVRSFEQPANTGVRRG